MGSDERNRALARAALSGDAAAARELAEEWLAEGLTAAARSHGPDGEPSLVVAPFGRLRVGVSSWPGSGTDEPDRLYFNVTNDGVWTDRGRPIAATVRRGAGVHVNLGCHASNLDAIEFRGSPGGVIFATAERLVLPAVLGWARSPAGQERILRARLVSRLVLVGRKLADIAKAERDISDVVFEYLNLGGAP